MRNPSLSERMQRSRRPLWLLSALLTLLFLALAGCGGRQEAGQRQLKLAPSSRLPKEIAVGSVMVREAYQFALANPEVLEVIPCYCGCGADHGSVKDCFVREVRPDGTAVFDEMGLN